MLFLLLCHLGFSNMCIFGGTFFYWMALSQNSEKCAFLRLSVFHISVQEVQIMWIRTQTKQSSSLFLVVLEKNCELAPSFETSNVGIYSFTFSYNFHSLYAIYKFNMPVWYDLQHKSMYFY